jgi:hypothetical protein
VPAHLLLQLAALLLLLHLVPVLVLVLGVTLQARC